MFHEACGIYGIRPIVRAGLLVPASPHRTRGIDPHGRFLCTGYVQKAGKKGTGAEPIRIVLLLGAPGSGKGTQSALLADRFGLQTLSTGEMLRDEAKSATPAGFRLRQVLASGALVPDELVCNAVAKRLRAMDPAGAGLILDGFPRTLAQARALDQLLDEIGAELCVAQLDVPADVLQKRLSLRRQCATCGTVYNLGSNRSSKGSRCELDGGALVERDDDSEGIVARRLAAYQKETLPVFDHYARRAAGYRRIDGNRAPSEIANELREIVALTPAAVAA